MICCKDCKNFVRHYFKHQGSLRKMSVGHCVVKRHPNIKNELFACENFEEKEINEIEMQKKEVKNFLDNLNLKLEKLVEFVDQG